MNCKINSTNNLPIPHKLSSSSSASTSQLLTSSPSLLKCRAQSNYQGSPIRTNTQTPSQATGLYNVKFHTLKACKLGISRYPDFEYNAEGGAGTGIGTAIGKEAEAIVTAVDDDEVAVSFDMETLYIPALTGATTRFLGLPLPPFLKIEIAPEVFKGTINKRSGQVNMQFRARFWFSVGSLYRAAPLVVQTTLTSEESKGTMRSGKGKRMDEEGRCRLVGVAVVDPIDDVLMDSFLGLPTECIAVMNAKISISSS